MSSITEKVKNFPQTPGVYLFKDKEGKILYIGKATNLRSRVSSYFRSDANPRIANRPIEIMLHKVVDVEFQQTDSKKSELSSDF